MTTKERREATEQAWEDALILSMSEWTVPDPDVPGLTGERLLTIVVQEATEAMERLKAKGMLDFDGGVA